MNEQSFMKSLFHGVIAEELVCPFPEMGTSERDGTNAVLEGVRQLESEVDSAAIDAKGEIPAAVLEKLKNLGLFGMTVPQSYGGIGSSATSYARVIQEVAGFDASLAMTLGAHQSLGLAGILLFGSEEQKRKYLPKLASGESIAAHALTEHSAGSDAAAIQMRAELSPEGDTYVLNGSKIWVTNGGLADVFIVFARTSRSDEGQRPKVTAFIVERAMGVKSGPNDAKLGIRGASTTTLTFDDVKVPLANVLGPLGGGLKVAMEVWNSGRLGFSACTLGACRRLVRMSVERVQDRKAFGRSIGEFGLIKDKIAVMLANTFALESMTYMTAGLVDSRVADCSIEGALCKIFGAETLWKVVNETMQIAAGSGYMQEFPYERYLRDSRAHLVFDGTTEILRCFVALAGMQGPGQELLDVTRAIREPIKGMGVLSDFVLRRARSALGRERLTKAHPVLNRETVIFEEFTAELAQNVDKVLRKHGKDITEMQYTQKRVADMAIDLYAIASCVSRTTRAIERRGEEGARRELDLTTTFVTTAQRRLAAIVRSFESNDDELRKVIAGRAYTDGGYPFDVV